MLIASRGNQSEIASKGMGKMGHGPTDDLKDAASIREMLSCSGYSDKAIDYYLNRPSIGTLSDANQVSELTGACGDTMRVYLKVDQGRIVDGKMQVLGCPGAVASAMAAMEFIKGKTIEQARRLRDRDIFGILEGLPDQKQHCIRLAVKTVQKALDACGPSMETTSTTWLGEKAKRAAISIRDVQQSGFSCEYRLWQAVRDKTCFL